MSLLNILCLTVISFFASFPEQSQRVITDFRTNKEHICKQLVNLSPDEKLIALSIVAPEYSQYSIMFDFIELKTLYLMYLNTGTSNFSVGPFQMKPSFIEDMENFLVSDNLLKKQYSYLIPKGNARDKRKFRLENLSSWNGQLRYLELFIFILKIKTKIISFNNIEEQCKYWATVYNVGIYASPELIKKSSKKKSFPKYIKQFNYSDVAVEFYYKLREYDW